VAGTSVGPGASAGEHSLSAAPVFQAFFGYLATAALGSGIRLGVFDALAAGPREAAAVAQATGADARGVRILLEALAGLGFVERQPDGYRLTTPAEAFLVSSSPSYLGRLAHIFYSDWQWQGFLRLADAVRAGGTAVEDQDLEQPLHPFWETYVCSWGAAGYPAAAALTELLAPWIAERRPFASLDVACGDGLYSFLLAEAHPQAAVTLLDQANVLATTRRLAHERGLDERASFLEGDLFELDLGGPYDLIIASNVFHLFGADRCRRLLRRLRSALKTDGRLAIHEFAPDPVSADLVSRLFSLIMLVRTHGGEAHTLTDYGQMLAETGFTAPEVHRLEGQPTSLLLSRRAS
jgi:C-methyltransferase